MTRREEHPPRCDCGYDLSGAEGSLCPECARPCDPAALAERWRKRRVEAGSHIAMHGLIGLTYLSLLIVQLVGAVQDDDSLMGLFGLLLFAPAVLISGVSAALLLHRTPRRMRFSTLAFGVSAAWPFLIAICGMLATFIADGW